MNWIIKSFICNKYVYRYAGITGVLVMNERKTPAKKTTEKKKWDKLNVIPGTNKILKQIALDEDKYVYKLVDEMLRERYPKYFRKTGKNI